jgi:hypothetical protein
MEKARIKNAEFGMLHASLRVSKITFIYFYAGSGHAKNT